MTYLRTTLVACGLLIFGLASLEAPLGHAAEPAANPFAAHNAYPWRLYGNQRLPRALKAGLKHIEIDITYNPERQTVVATHDSEPRGGEPELSKLLDLVWKHWQEAPGDGYTLILDFKSSSPEIAQGVHDLLLPRRELLSSLPKSQGEEFRPGKITVCLTGNTAAHRLYANLIDDDGEFLAFGDHGAGRWQEDASRYVPDEPAGFVRFVTYEKSIFMNSPDGKTNDDVSLDRLREVVGLANERGYRMRIYTINPARRNGQLDDGYWRKCVEAGVPMISTDAYEIARDWWNDR